MGNRNRLAHFMCHSTETADRFYALVLDRHQGCQIRKTFDMLTSAASRRPPPRLSTSQGQQ
ncbi:hypothetical protein EYF80_056895 [Liparis tanakae]|uniref:Uncharacterized protein n=1 Tax=Liparis tanakae TaxID=230148 RepID=A0A4Z2EVP7_9TELE|nr:hypothetical protein EYF80_056895 [Liparis tanakae]